MSEGAPKVVVLAGPNGAGKSTAAARLLLGPLQVDEFVNADTIASGLSAFAQERVALEAGRIMLRRLDELAATRASFAFETTTASRSYAFRLRNLRQVGYQVHLVFLWLPSEDAAVARVEDRVRSGGHDIPEPIIRRRYLACLSNFFRLYLPLADIWQLVDNSGVNAPRLIAAGGEEGPVRVHEIATWQAVLANIGTQ
jgi:predicted ABC-type ATPase